jgi:nicotinate (nicotinamide) nucleotide adenylyltransferase
MEFSRRNRSQPARLGVFPGTFNPPTRAHLELAAAAREMVDEVLFVMPRHLPHKSYEGVSLAERLRMLDLATGDLPGSSLAVTERGLFIEIARECRAAYGPAVRLSFLCGRDAAERAANWDYGRPGAFREMLREFELIVAARVGVFDPPAELRDRIRHLRLPAACEQVSATEVRESIQQGKLWMHLVPEAIVPLVAALYGK